RRSYARAEALRRELADERRNDPDTRFQLARTFVNTGSLCRATGRLKEAVDAYEAGIKVQEKLARKHPLTAAYQYEWAMSSNVLAAAYLGLGDERKAEIALGRAEQLLKQLVEIRPRDRYAHLELGVTHIQLGRLAIDRAPAQARDLLDSGRRTLEG